MIKQFTQVERSMEEIARIERSLEAIDKTPDYGSMARISFVFAQRNRLFEEQRRFPQSWYDAVRLVKALNKTT